MAAKDELGRAGEARASAHLEGLGMRVVDRNWRCAEGEIDIVAIDDHELVVVEVKTRSTLSFGHPLEAIGPVKQARLWRLGRAWARAHPDVARGLPLRLDAVAVTGRDPEVAEVDHLRDLR